MGSTKFQEVKIQGYEPWEMGSEEGDNSSEYEFDTLRDYDSDNSDSMNFSMQTLETLDFEEKIREINNSSSQRETLETEIFYDQTRSDVEKHFQSQVHENDSRIPERGSQAYRKLVGECRQNSAKCIITKYDDKGQPKVDKRKSIIGRKSILAEKGI